MTSPHGFPKLDFKTEAKEWRGQYRAKPTTALAASSKIFGFSDNHGLS
jgi:hypothetical protein